MNAKKYLAKYYVIRFFASVGSGVLLATAFPPVEERLAAWVGLVPLFLIAKYTRPCPSFRWGFLGGMVFWLFSLSWLLRLWSSGGILVFVILAWVTLAAYCALYMGLFLMLASSCFYHLSRSRNILFVFLAPLAWAGCEYLRSVLLTGFPWNALGISQYRNISVIQIAEWGGVYAVSAIIVLLNATLALTAARFIDIHLRRGKSSEPRFILMIGLTAVTLCLYLGISSIRRIDGEKELGTKVRLVTIQPNIPQNQKWTDEFQSSIYDRLMDYTQLAIMSSPDLVIWPETAVPYCLESDIPTYSFCRRLARSGSPLLVGSMEVQGGDEGGRQTTDDERQRVGVGEEGYPGKKETQKLYNSSFMMNREGDIVERYRKRHLVIFGEYVPFDKTITCLQKLVPIGASCSPGTKTTVFQLPIAGQPQTNPPAPDLLGGRAGNQAPRTLSRHRRDKNQELRTKNQEPSIPFSVLICFEDVMPYLSREAVRKGARLLINQTNDAWFDGSSASRQHLSHCVFRCIENRVTAVRSANTGISCFIDRAGRIDPTTIQTMTRKTERNTQYRTETVMVPGNDMTLTFYTRYGDLPFAIPCGILSAIVALCVLVKERRRTRLDITGHNLE